MSLGPVPGPTIHLLWDLRQEILLTWWADSSSRLRLYNLWTILRSWRWDVCCYGLGVSCCQDLMCLELSVWHENVEGFWAFKSWSIVGGHLSTVLRVQCCFYRTSMNSSKGLVSKRKGGLSRVSIWSWDLSSPVFKPLWCHLPSDPYQRGPEPDNFALEPPKDLGMKRHKAEENSSVVKGTFSSSKRSEFSSQHPCFMVHN